MSLLSLVEAKLPPGFRFHPRDDELICDYLAIKIVGDDNRSFLSTPMLVDIDLNKCEPWDLPVSACVAGKEWYFFSLRDRKYATGQRTNRATISGYWKATGKDRVVSRKGVVVGMRKTLVFYQGRAPKGKKTEWVMHEFRTQGLHAKEDWVLCKVFYKKRGISTRATTDKDEDEDEDDSTSHSLPPLMENNFMSYDQTQVQVPCFSNNNSVQSSSSSQGFINITNLGQSKGHNYAQHELNNISCDNNNKLVKTVLNGMTKIEPNLVDGSERDYLPHYDNLPSLWSPFNYWS